MQASKLASLLQDDIWKIKTYTMPKTERDTITSIISDVLNADDRVISHYLYDSFITGPVPNGNGTGSFFNDIDIFVFIRKTENPYACSVNIEEKLFDAVTKAGFNVAIDDFDVRVINVPPYDLVIDLLCNGILIVDKAPDFRRDYVGYI